jgi:hypothetical protein
MTIAWLNKNLVLTNEGEIYEGKDNSASQTLLLKDNAESNSFSIAVTISNLTTDVNENHYSVSSRRGLITEQAAARTRLAKAEKRMNEANARDRVA